MRNAGTPEDDEPLVKAVAFGWIAFVVPESFTRAISGRRKNHEASQAMKTKLRLNADVTAKKKDRPRRFFIVPILAVKMRSVVVWDTQNSADGSRNQNS